jgi:integrase
MPDSGRGRTARRAEGVPFNGVHFHHLRHAGNHMIAAAGASLRELMERMGHSSSRAALIYLRSTDERQRTLADAVASQAQAELAGSRGTSVARPGQAAGHDRWLTVRNTR